MHVCMHVDACSPYQVLMAAPHPGTQPRQVAAPVPLPPGMFHSDESALCQSNHCAALCAGCPSGTCLEQKQCLKSKTNQHLYSNLKSQEAIQVVPATALSRPSSSSHKWSDACSYWSVNLEITQQSESSRWNKQLIIRSTVKAKHTSRHSSSQAQQAYKTHPGKRGRHQ